MQIACKDAANDNAVAAVAEPDPGLERERGRQRRAVIEQARVVELVAAQLGAAGKERIVAVHTRLDVPVALRTFGLLDFDGQGADHGVAFTTAADSGRQIHQPATLGPHRQPRGDAGREHGPELRVGCQLRGVLLGIAATRIERVDGG